jgi:hypothetical protein
MNTLHLCELNSMGFIPHLYKIDRELFLILKKSDQNKFGKI